MRRHLKSRFKTPRNKRLNEVITSDAYFAIEKSIEGKNQLKAITLYKYFWGMTSKILYVAGMKTES
jgi:hypothetical protein